MALCWNTHTKLVQKCFREMKSNSYRSLKLWVKSQNIIARSLVYPEYGDPSQVIEEKEIKLMDPNDHEVAVKMLAAPVNPADINTIQGVYPMKPPLPAVGGNEGVGEVVAVGAAVEGLEVGDRVVPKFKGWGTWTTHAVLPATQVFKVPLTLSVVQAATLTVNPCAAYMMLKDFVNLKPGDVVIQNAANGSCGSNLIQLCKIWGVHTVNVIRAKENFDEVKQGLLDLGATYVLAEDEVKEFDAFRTGRLPKPQLAVNAVGGKNAMQLFRHLDNNGYYVTYGGMSRKPVMVPTGVLIFGNVKVIGFWLTRAKEDGNDEKFETMYNDLISLMVAGKLRPPCHQYLIPFSKFRQAMDNTLNPERKRSVKYVLDFSQVS